MLFKLVTEKVVMGLPLSILWGNTLEEWVILAHNDFPSIGGEEREWYPLQRLNSVPHRLLKIQTPPSHERPALMSANKPMLMVTMPGVAATVKTVIDELTHGCEFKLVYLLHTETVHRTHKNQNTSIDQPENWWNMHLLLYDTLTFRAKPSSIGRLSHCSWSFGIFDDSHRYKTKNSIGWRIATNAKIGFKLQVTATLGFHSLYDWYYWTIWLCSGAPGDPKDDTVMEMHSAEALYSTVKSLMHAIQTEVKDAQQDAAHRIIQIVKPWMIRRCSWSKFANGKLLVWIAKKNAHLVHLEWTRDVRVNLQTLEERHISQGASGVWRVHRWWLACFPLVLEDTKDQNEISGQW